MTVFMDSKDRVWGCLKMMPENKKPQIFRKTFQKSQGQYISVDLQQAGQFS